MIEETSPLIFADAVRRPDPKLVEQFRGVPASFVVDALGGGGALDFRVKPLIGHAVLGVALTCDCGPSDNLALTAAIAECEKGDVLVAATRGFRNAAVTGDVLMGIARNRGAVGLVTDGVVRDLDELEKIGLPIFAVGATPNSPGKRGPGSVGLPVVCGGMTIATGDILVGDRDGVVVVPHARIEATLKALERVKAAEAAMAERVRGGLTALPFPGPGRPGRD